MSSSYNLPDAEKLATCPYNQAHQVVAHRMPMHLIRCRRSHSTAGTKVCRFNASHVFSIEEIADHEKNCSDRLDFEILMEHQATSKMQPYPSSLSLSSVDTGASFKDGDENWDDDEDHAGYDPKKKCLESNVMRLIQHGTPQQRKELRELEYIRLTRIQENIDAGNL